MKKKSWLSKKINSWNDWINGIYAAIFPAASSITSNNITESRNANTTVDLTFPDTVNYDLAMDLYYNKKAGYKLGAFFCYPVIAIPLAFMGFPHFDCEDWNSVNNKDWWEKRLEFYNRKMVMDKQEIQKICHITGTVAVFPWFDSEAGQVRLYFIKSKYISDIFINPDTQRLTGIVTSINYSFKWEDGKVYFFTEKKVYTKTKIITTRTGTFPNIIRASEIRKNPTGILPIIFTNDKEVNEFEGHSDYERILPLVKAYSQVNIRAHEEAANMKAKLVQNVENWEAWKKANGFNNINEISIENIDFIVNTVDEKTEIMVPQNLLENHIKLMEVDFWSLVETSGIPEIYFGLELSGNHASATQQASVGLAFVKKKRLQAQNPYNELLDAIMRLDAMAYNQIPPENLICTWDELSNLTEVERSEIFDNWCSAIQKLTESHAIDLQTVHKILIELTSGKITENYEEFKEQIEEYGTFRAMLEQEYGGMKDFTQDNPDDELQQNRDRNGNGNKRLKKIIQGIIK